MSQDDPVDSRELADVSELALQLYEELRSLARRELAGESAHHTLQPTALVHEAYLRLSSSEDPTFESRAHFFASAARAIRRVLVDHARRRSSQRRGGHWERVPFEDACEPPETSASQWLSLDVAIERLARLSPTKARIVELRFFAGMSTEEVAHVLDVSEVTVRREWRVAKAWLRSEFEEADGA